MSDDMTHIESVIRAHAERLAPHEDLFRRVVPEVVAAQGELVRGIMAERETARQSRRDIETLFMSRRSREEEEVPLENVKRIRELIHGQTKSGAVPIARSHSAHAKAMTLQPVRDITVDNVVVLTEDRKLDILGAPFLDAWSIKAGDGDDLGGDEHPEYPPYFRSDSYASHWTNRDRGIMGFSQQAHGSVIWSAAALYVGFKPPIAPGIAQVRPYLPYSYRWDNLSFKSFEDTAASLGVLVWSWNMSGGDLFKEQDHRYLIWRDAIGFSYFNTSQSPSFYDNPGQPDLNFDSDYGFSFGNEAPYFGVRPNRIYVAAVWCLGECGSRGERLGWARGVLHVELPWVVIGYQ